MVYWLDKVEDKFDRDVYNPDNAEYYFDMNVYEFDMDVIWVRHRCISVCQKRKDVRHECVWLCHRWI